MEGSRTAAPLTLWGKGFSPLQRRPRYEAHLESALFDHITMKITWCDWKHQDKVKTEHWDRLGRAQSFTGRFVTLLKRNRGWYQTQELFLWLVPQLPMSSSELHLAWSSNGKLAQTMEWFTHHSKPKQRIYSHKSQARLQRCCSSGLCFLPLDSVCTGTAGRHYFALMVIKNKVPKRGLSLRKTEGRASVKNSTTAAVQSHV